MVSHLPMPPLFHQHELHPALSRRKVLQFKIMGSCYGTGAFFIHFVGAECASPLAHKSAADSLGYVLIEFGSCFRHQLCLQAHRRWQDGRTSFKHVNASIWLAQRKLVYDGHRLRAAPGFCLRQPPSHPGSAARAGPERRHDGQAQAGPGPRNHIWAAGPELHRDQGQPHPSNLHHKPHSWWTGPKHCHTCRRAVHRPRCNCHSVQLQHGKLSPPRPWLQPLALIQR